MDSQELVTLLTGLIDKIGALVSVYAETARDYPAVKGLIEFLVGVAVELGAVKGRLTAV